MSQSYNKISLIGDYLPQDVTYLSLFGILDKIGRLVDSDYNEEKRENSINILVSLIERRFFQAFVTHDLIYDTGKKYKLADELPYQDIEGSYSVRVNLSENQVMSGEYVGELAIPEYQFQRAIPFIKQDYTEEHATNFAEATLPENIRLASGVNKRLAAIKYFIGQVNEIAQRKGIDFDVSRMPGTKLDLTKVLKHTYPKIFGHYRDSTFENYYEKCGLSFCPGKRSGETDFWTLVLTE